MRPSPDLVIDGKTVPGEAGTYPVVNPVRPDEVVLDAPWASEHQLDQAVAAAHRAQPAWAALDPAERAEQLVAAAQADAAAIDEIARFLTREHGKVLWEATFDVGTIAGMAAAFAPLVAESLAPRTSAHRRWAAHRGRARPPWGGRRHHPLQLAGLGTGQQGAPCPAGRQRRRREAPADLPRGDAGGGGSHGCGAAPGLLNVVNGPDVSLGQALVTHPGIDMVTFTGGVPAGRAVMAAAAATTKPVVLELGGNDPAIIAPDIEIDAALAERMVPAAFTTSGQVCMAIKRVYVPEEHRPALVEALVDRLAAEVVGDGLCPEVTMGPVHTAAARQRAEAMVAEAAAAGARIHRPATVRDRMPARVATSSRRPSPTSRRPTPASSSTSSSPPSSRSSATASSTTP